MTEKSLPIIQERDRAYSISIFKREKDGKTFYGACIQRSFKRDENSDWEREQINLFPEDLLNLSALCIETHNTLRKYRNENKPQKASSSYPQSSYEPLDDDIPF